ncbi:hypothetical protein ACN47E_003367 [Coniothyrium glycines]
MSTAQTTASPRAPRGKPQPVQGPQAPHNNGRQSQRKPRGNRAHNANNQHDGNISSPIKIPSGTDHVSDSAIYADGDTDMPTGPRVSKKHTKSQPSTDRAFPPGGHQAALTDSESVPNNPSATPAKIQGAYAGPTFHASPAPSALPIPKFLSRSVPAKTSAGPPTPPPEDSSDSANSPSPSASPSRAPIPFPQRSAFSPLDMLFKADQAERARHSQGSPASGNVFSPPQAQRPHHFNHDSYNSSNGVFPIELDGESKNMHMSPSPLPSPAALRSFTDPNKVPQLKDLPQQSGGNDVMQDLMNRLSMSQKKNHAGTPPRADAQVPSGSQSRRQTPSPFHDGRPPVRSVSGPSTPQQVNPEQTDFFYGNRNLSPLFSAAKGDNPKRNSGLRTEVTADSPMLPQGALQDFPSIVQQPIIDPNTFSRGPSGNGYKGPPESPRGSVPFSQPQQQSPHRGRGMPGRQQHQPRGAFHGRGNFYGAHQGGGRPAGHTSPAPKPATSMMSFVPASVAAKGKPRSAASSTPPATGLPLPAMKTSTQDTSAMEQDLKRLLNLNNGNAPSIQ